MFVMTESGALPLMPVLPVKAKNRISTNRKQRYRDILYYRQKKRCYYCACRIGRNSYGCQAESRLDHKIPFSRGGDNGLGNLVLACKKCDIRKGDRTSEEYFRAKMKQNNLQTRDTLA
jgi:CRISPR/Cas system Type II protein with McrA/HNH and RuvC-like nuclease domain